MPAAAKAALERISYKVREFPGGFETRVVTEPSSAKNHWVLLNPMGWVKDAMKRAGWVPLPDDEVARMERAKANLRAKRGHR